MTIFQEGKYSIQVPKYLIKNCVLCTLMVPKSVPKNSTLGNLTVEKFVSSWNTAETHLLNSFFTHRATAACGKGCSRKSIRITQFLAREGSSLLGSRGKTVNSRNASNLYLCPQWPLKHLMSPNITNTLLPVSRPSQTPSFLAWYTCLFV